MGCSFFLSHNANDKNWVDWIAQSARHLGIDCYTFEHDPQPGTHLASKVQQAIDVCDAMVVFLTSSSYNAPYVQQ